MMTGGGALKACLGSYAPATCMYRSIHNSQHESKHPEQGSRQLETNVPGRWGVVMDAVRP